MKKRHDWDMLQADLYDLVADKLFTDMPEISLRVAVIVMAAKDRDKEYFEGEIFWQDCAELGLNDVWIYALIRKMWE